MRPRFTLALANFLSVGHFYLITYILGPYLATIIPEIYAGLVIAAGAIMTLALFPYVPDMVARVGARVLALTVALTEGVLLLLLAIIPASWIAVALVACACALSPFIAYALDLLLEATVISEATTGKVRTAFLTAGNIPLLLAPLGIALILGSGTDYARVFLAASVSLLPFFLLLTLARFPAGNPPTYMGLIETFKCMCANRDLSATLAAGFLLQIFYHLAPLYVSLYLHQVLGIPWNELGWIFAIMLIPFVLIEYPAGAVGDRRGDRGLLALGFMVMGVSFALIALLTPETPLIAILFVLITTRIGAALVEAMTEGHFFRSVTERDVTSVELFRMMRPTAALIAPLLGTAILLTGGYTALFISAGLTTATLGVFASLRVRDARPPETTPYPSEARPSLL